MLENIKHKMEAIGGSVKKRDDRYLVRDNETLERLVLSSTTLKPNKSTTGHSHADSDEIYFFISGIGSMTLGKRGFLVESGDVVLVKAGEFHRVKNSDDIFPLYFVCVFNGKRETGEK